jgi:AbrB family looped-hinge helix DNA binding protein
MTAASLIDEKGQVTLPEEIRRKMDLHPGDQVEFHYSGSDDVRLTKFRPKMTDEEFDAWLESVKGALRPEFEGMSSDEIMDVIRPHRLDRD